MGRKLTQEEFIQRSITHHSDKYDYSIVEYVNSSTKVSIICPEHGIFKQKPSIHMRGSQCPKCQKESAAINRLIDRNTFINKSILKHGVLYDYSSVEVMEGIQKQYTIICPKHGPFKMRADNHMNGAGCYECGKESMSKTQTISYEDILLRFHEKHGNKYKYPLNSKDYINTKNKIPIICDEHGVFQITPAAHIKGSGCPKCAKNKPLPIQEWKQQCNIIHNNKYNYDSVVFTKYTESITIECPKHGTFQQKAGHHLKGGNCPACNRESQNRKSFVVWKSECQEIHNNKYTYDNVVWSKATDRVDITCPEHGDFNTVAAWHSYGSGCPICRKSPISKGEISITSVLDNLNIKYLSEHKFENCVNIKPLPFDFYLPELNICVEFDGLQHFKSVDFFGGEDAFEGRKINDRIKSLYCHDNNIALLRIKYDQISCINDVIDYFIKNLHGLADY